MAGPALPSAAPQLPGLEVWRAQKRGDAVGGNGYRPLALLDRGLPIQVPRNVAFQQK